LLTEFGGYCIKKDTVIIANLYNAHHNQQYWKDPEEFRPDRFLDSKTGRLKKYEAFIPFSTG